MTYEPRDNSHAASFLMRLRVWDFFFLPMQMQDGGPSSHTFSFLIDPPGMYSRRKTLINKLEKTTVGDIRLIAHNVRLDQREKNSKINVFYGFLCKYMLC